VRSATGARACDLGELLASRPAGLDPEVGAIIAGAEQLRAVDVFEAMHRLAELRRAAQEIWDQVDALMLPTAPFHPTHKDVAADRLGVNERLGRFTNFVNLMDLAALAVPGPRRADGLPFGVTLLAPAFSDTRLLELGATWTGRPSISRSTKVCGSPWWERT
jgi:allophanate hydrolase